MSDQNSDKNKDSNQNFAMFSHGKQQNEHSYLTNFY